MINKMKKVSRFIFFIFILISCQLNGQEIDKSWALSRISVAHVRTTPGHSSELSTQILMGTPVKLLEQKGDWWYIEMPDGYKGYVIDNSLVSLSSDEMNNWKNVNRVIVTSIHQSYIYKTPSNKNIRNIITDVVNGVILLGEKSSEEYSKVVLPDGRIGYIKSEDISSIEMWANQEFNSEKILDVAYSMMGLSYLWGGTSTKALDCSGLAKVSYYANGIILRRDAYQQAETGDIISPENWQECQAGDLLFFGNKKTGRVTHVAIYDEKGLYIHASGRVKINSIDPSSGLYLSTPFFHASRIKSAIGTEGITQACKHPWYFKQK